MDKVIDQYLEQNKAPPKGKDSHTGSKTASTKSKDTKGSKTKASGSSKKNQLESHLVDQLESNIKMITQMLGIQIEEAKFKDVVSRLGHTALQIEKMYRDEI